MQADDLPPQNQSYLHWYYSSLGMPTFLLIVGATLLAMVVIVLLFMRGRGPAVPSAILFVLPLPLLIGVVCFLGGSITYLFELGEAGDQRASPTMFSYGLVSMLQASSCFCPLLMLSLPLLMALGFRANRPKV